MDLFKITGTAALGAALVAAFVKVYHYERMIPNPADPDGAMIPNPETEVGFAKRKVREYLHDVYIASKTGTDIEDLRVIAATTAKTEIAPVEVV